MSKFIVVTDMRESIGVEKNIGRKTCLNVDQIVSIQSIESYLEEPLGYKTIIVTVKDNYYVSESMLEISLY